MKSNFSNWGFCPFTPWRTAQRAKHSGRCERMAINMTGIFRLKRFWAGLLILPAVLLTTLADKYPATVERVYSSGLYPVLSGCAARITGLVPFSLAEFVIILLVVSILAYIIAAIRKIIKHRALRGQTYARLFATLLCLAGIIWFGFISLCGLNYRRLSLAEICGLDVHPSTVGELTQLCVEIAAVANEYGAKTPKNAVGVSVSSYPDWYSTAERAAGCFTAAGDKHPVLAGFYPRPKPVLASKAMSMADIVGVYFPFTFEANVNVDVPAYLIPSSMQHELAHYKGFMREDEANFISYTACMLSGDNDFIYSGAMLALIHSTNALYQADREAYWSVIDDLSDDVRRDFNASDEYWKQFEGPVAEVSEKVNDVYLKTNSQPSGVRSYGQMVDLLLAERRARIAN